MSEKKTNSTLVLVDGSNYMHRAFYALADLSNSRGFPTNAIYGFTNMLLKLLKTLAPDYIAVVFDVKGPTFRHEAYVDYKATRKATPETLAVQIPRIKEIVRGFSIPVIEKQGVEADDIIGTIARRQSAEGLSVVIVSGDKDFMQLISPGIIMIDTMKDKIYNLDAVKERFGVDPEQVPDILALTGDVSDNIPGLPGVGPKTAMRLVQEFGSVEGVIAQAEKIHNKSWKKAVLENVDQARLSRELVLIRTDLSLDFELEDCRYRPPDHQALKKIFTELEFSSLLQELVRPDEDLSGDYYFLNKVSDFAPLMSRLRQAEAFSLELIYSGTPMQSRIQGLALCLAAGEAGYLSLDDADIFARPDQEITPEKILSGLAEILADGAINKMGHDLKGLALALAQRGVRLAGVKADTMVAAYVLNPTRHNFDLADLTREYLGRRIASSRELLGNGVKAISFNQVEPDKLKNFACQRADAVFRLTRVLTDKIEKEGFSDLFTKLEMPLVSVLMAMEQKGVLLDKGKLKTLSLELEQLLTLAEKKIYQLAGERFNINSPKQLQAILFDKLKLPKGRRTKEGYSTDVEVLTTLARRHELPAEILAWRSMVKLKTTYIDVLPQLIHPKTGRVHTSYNQTVTATGRLSSSNPNLQNIPIRTKEGKRIRQAFVAPAGWLIISADYSQVELRVLAHLCQDQALIDTFNAGEDIHSRTAADVFGVFPEMVNAEMRRQAKVINFGILYGMGAFSLARELGVTQKEAQAYIDNYFRNFSGVKIYLEEILNQARKNGYVSTLFKRRRYLPEINSSNAPVRQFAERTAINTPIQGTAADLIKEAMINIARRLTEKGLATSMIMQVHDELVFEAPEAEREAVLHLVRKEMEGVMDLAVPLKVDIGVGKNWDEAHN